MIAFMCCGHSLQTVERVVQNASAVKTQLENESSRAFKLEVEAAGGFGCNTLCGGRADPVDVCVCCHVGVGGPANMRPTRVLCMCDVHPPYRSSQPLQPPKTNTRVEKAVGTYDVLGKGVGNVQGTSNRGGQG